MANWSSIRELYYQYQPEIRRYGVCLFGILIGLLARHWPLACCFFAALVAIHAFDRWGRPWAERGKKVLKGSAADKNHPRPPES